MTSWKYGDTATDTLLKRTGRITFTDRHWAKMKNEKEAWWSWIRDLSPPDAPPDDPDGTSRNPTA